MADPNSSDGVERRLQGLLSNPREDLNIEIKGWLDLSNESDKANLAQAMLALANSGGGYIIIGFTDEKGKWLPSSSRPNSLSNFNQDIVNGIIQGYAEPPFHCAVNNVINPPDGLIYPIIIVPSDSKVPIRAKRDGPKEDGHNPKHIRQFEYYIRRPGPKSERPQSAQEWDELIGRCIRASKEELISDIRAILSGFNAPAKLSSVENDDITKIFANWISASRGRLDELLAKNLPPTQPSLYSNGTWSAAYAINNKIEPSSLNSLLSILRTVEGHETGWPVWLIPNWTQPYPFDSFIECWLYKGERDPGDVDFWRASPKGMMYLLRGYQEDAYEELRAKVFDLTIPIWRVGECLLHAERLAKALNAEGSSILFEFRWAGLENRTLKTWASKTRMMWGNYSAKQDSVISRLDVPSNQIGTNLTEMVYSIVKPLYEVFDFFDIQKKIVQEELDELRRLRPRTA
jgi:hypothetical protein